MVRQKPSTSNKLEVSSEDLIHVNNKRKRSQPPPRLTELSSSSGSETETENSDLIIIDPVRKKPNLRKNRTKSTFPKQTKSTGSKKRVIRKLHRTEKIEVDMVVDDESEPLPSHFDAAKFREKHILVIDAGSSFTKISKATIEKTSQVVGLYTVEFGSEKEKVYPTKMYVNQNEQGVTRYAFGKKQIPALVEEWLELNNFKRILTILAMKEFQQHGITFQTDEVLFQMFQGMFEATKTNLRHDKKTKFARLGTINGMILTCPTGTPDSIKRLYRRCAARAGKIINESISLQDVFVIEEYILIKYYSDNNGREVSLTNPVLYADLGHLTLDIAVIERDPITGNLYISYKSGEVGGMFIIHDILKEHGLDPQNVMEQLFSSDPDEMLEELESNDTLKAALEQGMIQIFTPMAFVILHKQIKCLNLTGAIFKCSFFKDMIERLLTVDGMQPIIDRSRQYMHDQYQEQNIPSDLEVETTDSTRTLIEGASLMIERSLRTKQPVPITMETHMPEFENKYHAGILTLEDNPSKSTVTQNIISLDSVMCQLDKVQDVEIFIMKLSPLIDITKIGSITADNCFDIGVLEFERFTCLKVSFVLGKNKKKPNKKKNFITSVEVQNDSVEVSIHFQGTNFVEKKASLSIDRKGRLERVVPNEMRRVLSGREDDETTWYGVAYNTNFEIKDSDCEKLSPEEALLFKEKWNTIPSQK